MRVKGEPTPHQFQSPSSEAYPTLSICKLSESICTHMEFVSTSANIVYFTARAPVVFNIVL